MADASRPPVPVEPAASCTVRLLDAFEISYQGELLQLPPSGQRLVALLALESRPRTRERVASTLWPDAPVERGTANVRRALFGVLRQAPAAVVALGHALALGDDVGVDVRELGLTSLRADQEVPIPRDFSVLEAELLPEWPDPWLEGVREPVQTLRLHRLEDWARMLLARGRSRRALEAARVATRIDPLRESAQRLLAEAHLAEGNRADAIRQFRAYEAHLWRELRLRPSAELRALTGIQDTPAPRPAPSRDSLGV